MSMVRSWFGADPFPYGVRANRVALERLVRHSREQGLTSSEITLEDLFAPSTVAWDPEA